jgi:hypothetical protein
VRRRSKVISIILTKLLLTGGGMVTSSYFGKTGFVDDLRTDGYSMLSELLDFRRKPQNDFEIRRRVTRQAGSSGCKAVRYLVAFQPIASNKFA